MFHRLFRAFLVLALLASGSAFAAIPKVTMWAVNSTSYNTGTMPWAVSQSQACQDVRAKAELNFPGSWAVPGWSVGVSGSTPICNLTRTSTSGFILSSSSQCPANSSGTTTCTCNTNFEESGGTSCVPKKNDLEKLCLEGQTNQFTRRMTGKTGGSAPTGSCLVIDPPFPGLEGKGCSMTVGDSVGVMNADGTRSWSAMGSYTGATCTPAADQVLGDPRASKEDKCPGGFEGVVNGVSKCIAAEPDKGIEGTKTTTKNNPDGSTTQVKEQTKCNGENCTTTRTETTTPAGGGTPTINISGTTQSLADKCALDKTNPVCTKTGTTPPTQTTSGNGEDEGGLECGIEGKPACKVDIDEEGTPNLGTTFDAAKGELETNKGAAEAQINAASSIQAPTWSFSFQLPTGCTSYDVTTFKGLAFKMNPCTYQSTIHDLMSMIWAAVTAFCLIGMVGRTIREA
ncbi:hypothetical protein [Variovorax saccharolyticus]|uniref:hypothetical protein n=1 Tax=Variovorax saccharolyticus TaxID=3053516 RepID=UPI0025757B10|nr:hypothetical protein [Variovorax sp. J31P216]MDM0027769.1 hypothetical protein [Variovorax sp. J31P216]